MDSGPSTSQSQPILVRGRCACGRRFRIRNAVAGVAVVCPACRRPIIVTHADLRAAMVHEHLIPLQPEAVEPKEAILLDFGELTLASEGSQPGLTGQQAFSGSEALMFTAMRGWTMSESSGGYEPTMADVAGTWFGAASGAARGFVLDLLASFYFVGSARNALNVMLSALACSLLTIALYVSPPIPLLGFAWAIVALCLLALAAAFFVQMCGSIVQMTARGEDEIPWVPDDWSVLHDGILPIFRIALTSAICAAPAAVAEHYLPDGLGGRELAVWAAAALGAMLWPMGILSVALTGSLASLRPDLIVKGIYRLGAWYLLTCLVALATLGAWGAALLTLDTLISLSQLFTIFVPLVLVTASLYFGYVLFRTLGLLVRHFGRRVPWLT